MTLAADFSLLLERGRYPVCQDAARRVQASATWRVPSAGEAKLLLACHVLEENVENCPTGSRAKQATCRVVLPVLLPISVAPPGTEVQGSVCPGPQGSCQPRRL